MSVNYSLVICFFSLLYVNMRPNIVLIAINQLVKTQADIKIRNSVMDASQQDVVHFKMSLIMYELGARFVKGSQD